MEINDKEDATSVGVPVPKVYNTSSKETLRALRRSKGIACPGGGWAYVKKHNVQLLDEYDQIHLNFTPFWGIDPMPLETIQCDWEAHVHSYTLAKSSLLGPLHIGNETLPEDEAARDHLLIGANQLINLLVEVEDDPPDIGRRMYLYGSLS
ncbi:uncharacterized protein EDB91DRAFT_1087642 [Suillus paluster]|uniref:uncharacterized protein n=1 Tax=Suillus paluster TaxID=48578 RepID=UPI001B87691F|nr:uncharacterized protein EDB91DRAFT_1087642 [Suillus paluster]KAG1723988.1 hypothetical protein EDB91DRAFT_1087642 [Suillus paluster]